jgi:dienelactone hydrolase
MSRISFSLFLSAAFAALISSQCIAADMTLDEFVAGGWISAPYGVRPDGREHGGVDVAAPVGTPIAAPGDAIVWKAEELLNNQPLNGKGVMLNVGGKFLAKFTHLDSFSVKKGDRLSKGTVFATVGKTGGARRAHLHIEVYPGPTYDKRVDPASVFAFLRGENWKEDTFYQQAMVVSYEGYGTDTFAEIYQNKWRHDEARLSGYLFLPDGQGPFPVVILQHGSGHPSGLDAWWHSLIPELEKAGIGAFIANSFTGRGIDATTGDQGRLSRAARDIDALMALKSVSRVKGVDPDRIGITGYSFGGAVAIDVASERIAQAVLGTGLRFAAHLPVYPNCILYDRPEMTGAPIHFLLGAKDDLTPMSFCLRLIDELTEVGIPASQSIYEDGGHGFVKNRDLYMPNAMSGRNCEPVRLTRDGYLEGDGFSDRDAGWLAYISAVMKSCATRGAHAHGTAATRQRALDETVRYFSNKLLKK